LSEEPIGTEVKRYHYRTFHGATWAILFWLLTLVPGVLFVYGNAGKMDVAGLAFIGLVLTIFGCGAFYYTRRFFYTEIVLHDSGLIEQTGKRELRIDLTSVVAYHEKGEGNWIEFHSGKKSVLTVDDSLSNFNDFVQELKSKEVLKWR
jgi:hypothetical protein